MKTIFKLFTISFFIVLVIFIITDCEKEKGNQPPECVIVTPAENTSFEKGEIVAILIETSDPDGTVKEINLYIDGVLVTSKQDSSLSYEWNTGDAVVGSHEIKAIAFDELELETSSIVNISIEPLELTKPTGLTLTEEPTQILLSWNGVDKALSYNIYWTDDNSDPSESSNKIGDIETTQTTHTDLDHTKTYKYRVQAVNGEYTSPLSDYISGSPEMPPLQAPTGLNASESGSSIKLTWNAVDFEGVEYKVKRRESTKSWYSEIATGITTNQYTDNDIEKGIGYYYCVIAVDNTNNRTSDESESSYIVITKIIYESERNNANISNTLSYTTHYYSAEDVTYGLDKFRIKGNYSGAYSIYSSGSYKYFEADCFEIRIKKNDIIKFKLISGQMSGLWAMDVSVRNYYKYTSGNYGDGKAYSFSSYDTYTYKGSSLGTNIGTYIAVNMWEDLINFGSYNYEIEITIERE